MITLKPPDAERVVESLRAGIPPAGHLRDFTVGRQQQIQQLISGLDPEGDDGSTVLLLQANYGAGKTHLLRLVREEALDNGYVVALVTVDSKSNVRFNRMDQVLGAVMRNIELPGVTDKGIGAMFDAFLTFDEESLTSRLAGDRRAVSDQERWSSSSVLRSDPLWIALRSWHLSRGNETKPMISDWLSNSWEYKSRPGNLYRKLIKTLPPSVKDPRDEKAYYQEKSFMFDVAGHRASWDALNDLDLLARMSGFRGLVLLFDEFEDVIQNMNNIAYERAAFNNLLRLFDERTYVGSAYFAVTPEFSERCRDRLFQKEHYDFPVDRFDDLERIKMSPVTKRQFGPLAKKIRDTHGLAYSWEPVATIGDNELDRIVDSLFTRGSADQVRQAMIGLVEALDQALDE